MAWGGVNVKDLSLVFPILSRKFWFVSVYFILCFLAPALNKLVEVSSRKEMRWIVLILIVVTYLWATLSYFLNFPQIIPDFGGGIVNFVTLYLAGRYLRLYAKVPSAKWILLVLVGCQVGALTMELGLSHFLGFSFTSLENDNSLTTFVSAVCIFLLFTKLHFHSRIVNLLAINVLAVYVLHMNEVAWPFIARVFSLSSMHGMGIIAACVYVPVIVFVVASLIEWGRRSLTSIIVH